MFLDTILVAFIQGLKRFTDGEETEDSKNITAERALLRVIAKLEGRQEGIAGVLSTENQVEWLIAQATSVMNLYRLFEGWQPYL